MPRRRRLKQRIGNMTARHYVKIADTTSESRFGERLPNANRRFGTTIIARRAIAGHRGTRATFWEAPAPHPGWRPWHVSDSQSIRRELQTAAVTGRLTW